MLRDRGYDVRIYEALDDVGGTWHPDLAYAGLALHTPAYRAQFHGQPPLAAADHLRRLSAAEVQAQCRDFARDRGLQPLIALHHRVLGVDWDTARGVHHVTVHDAASGGTRTVDHDAVVSTQFNAPRVPRWPGVDRFDGEILHASAMKTAVCERLARTGARVVLVGGSKSAADLALQCLDYGIRCTWLVRRMYWFLSYDKAYWDAARGRPGPRRYRWLYFAGLGLSRGPVSTRAVFAAWRLAGLLRTPGRPSRGVTAFHHGWMDDRQLARLRTGTTQVYDEIARLDGREIETQGGRRLPCDVLVCATGCDPIAAPIRLSVDGAPVDYAGVERLYRRSVIPALPRLVFTGYWMFGFGPLNGYHRAAWLIDFFERDRSPAALDAAARAEPQAPRPFARGSFLFDGGHDLLTTVKIASRTMADGIYDHADVVRYHRALAVDHVYAPFAGAHAVIAGQRSARTQPAVARRGPPPRTLEEWRAGGARIETSGGELFHRDDGEGPALLCLHGFPSASWDWQRLWPDLTGRFRCIAPDLLGFGFSAKPRGADYTIVAQADRVEALLASLRVTRVHVLAHDYGDSVAQDLLARHEARLATGQDGLRLASVCFLNGGVFPEAHRAPLALQLLRSPAGPLLASALTARRFTRGLSRLFTPMGQPSPDELADWWTLMATHDGPAVAPRLAGYVGERRRHRARWIHAMQTTRVPLRCVVGADDPIAGRHMADRYRQVVPQPDVVLLERTGHYPQVERPAGVVDALDAFFTERALA